MKKIAVILLQVGYWILYACLALFIIWASLNPGSPARQHFWRLFWRLPSSVALTVPAVLGFYTAYSLLFSRLLKKKRLFLLLTSAIGVSIGSAIVAWLLMDWLFPPGLPFAFRWDIAAAFGSLSMVALVNAVLGLVMKGFVTWYGDIRLKEELNRKNFEMELALIKSQLSPHFLFNTLNNIDVLIEKDAGLASRYLNKLSDMLRFMLYETKTGPIPMGKELDYIEKYLELQRIRIANPEAIRYTVEGQPGQWMVEPMLFLPFIENAFKHADKKTNGAIHIRFALGKDSLVFDCENRYNPVVHAGGSSDAHSGLGGSLIRRRLGLLYPGRHTLVIRAENEIYKAKLTLEAHAN